jgi:hypothetical protein
MLFIDHSPSPDPAFSRTGLDFASLIAGKCGTRRALAEGIPASFPLEAGMRIAHISAGSQRRPDESLNGS